MTVKELLEIIVLVVGVGGGAAGGGFAFASYRFTLTLQTLQLKIEKANLIAIENNLKAQEVNSEAMRKMQKNLDAVLVMQGINKTRIADIEGKLQTLTGFQKGKDFPEENIPKVTQWNIEDA